MDEDNPNATPLYLPVGHASLAVSEEQQKKLAKLAQKKGRDNRFKTAVHGMVAFDLASRIAADAETSSEEEKHGTQDQALALGSPRTIAQRKAFLKLIFGGGQHDERHEDDKTTSAASATSKEQDDQATRETTTSTIDDLHIASELDKWADVCLRELVSVEHFFGSFNFLSLLWRETASLGPLFHVDEVLRSLVLLQMQELMSTSGTSAMKTSIS
ncbi:unnamed protein product, partial [Amoebophrya sp. A25]|eukprot:GSA25T00017847001.1